VTRAGIHIPIDDNIPFPGKPEDRVLAIDAALKRLLQLNERQARMVEARFFGGLEMSEIATLLDVSEATVQRDWRLARAWLALELSGER
jgi:DNA-directed RNA polymerase specialized sigma24 family protein